MQSKAQEIADAEGDLGVKIGSKEEKAWTDLLSNAQKELASLKRQLVLTAGMIETCKAEIALEKAKFK